MIYYQRQKIVRRCLCNHRSGHDSLILGIDTYLLDKLTDPSSVLLRHDLVSLLHCLSSHLPSEVFAVTQLILLSALVEKEPVEHCWLVDLKGECCPIC